jgi:hypothetical protein
MLQCIKYVFYDDDDDDDDHNNKTHIHTHSQSHTVDVGLLYWTFGEFNRL